jgi:ferrochelatase
VPLVLRWPLARLIAGRRAPVAREIYTRLGGRSPLLANTKAQAQALESVLGPGYRCFVAMRYWRPFSAETVHEVVEWGPDEIVCLPLYPQFSTTTTASSLAAWEEAARQHGLARPTRCVRSYPCEAGLIEALVGLIRPALDAASAGRDTRLLLTAHGLPMKIVRAGDPYASQVEQTAAAVVDALARSGLDWRVCYQSRVGPLRWLEPSTEDEIRRAGREGVPLVVAPISFVSEHSETLVELDLDYRDLAEASGVRAYHRVATVSTAPAFIGALASVVHRALS